MARALWKMISQRSFYSMNISELKEELDRGLIGPRVLLSGARLMDESSRDAPEYTDRKNYPFWYFLGKQLGVKKKAFHIGPGLGLVPYCLLQCCMISDWVCFGGNKPFITKNIQERSPHTRVSFYPKIEVQPRDFDLALLTAEYDYDAAKKFLDTLWNGLEAEGLLVVDYITSEAQGEAFRDFCGVRNREPIEIATRYGAGIIIK